MTHHKNLKSKKAGILGEVLEGLGQPQKRLPSKFFYDKRGSELFEQICSSDEYYLTNIEIQIMEDFIHEIAEVAGSGSELIELGSGSSYKTRLLLDYMEDVRAYLPVDISEDFLQNTARQLQTEYPELNIYPVAADYTKSLELPAENPGRRIIYYPGSTIGNFTPVYARGFLNLLAQTTGTNGGLLIGVDLRKEREIMEAAYNDSTGITAEFNKNILWRLNRDLGADFKPDRFIHKAFFNENESRIEMHLKSCDQQKVHIGGRTFKIVEGETIHTENSYKYSIEMFRKLTEGLFRIRHIWTDGNRFFAVLFLEVV